MTKKLESTELIINPNGRIYHLNLLPCELATNIILVGDPDRVPFISQHFDNIEVKVNNREINTHTGYIGKKRISVMSTGMGTDNIDIVLNEIDALFNIDFDKRELKAENTCLNIIRLGTSGTLIKDIPIDTAVVSTHSVGLDGMLYYYNDCYKTIDNELTNAFIQQTNFPNNFPKPYIVEGSSKLINHFKFSEIKITKGITATAPGFYAPQGRELRLKPKLDNINDLLASFNYNNYRIVNFEMETSALYGLAKMLGHNAMTICAIIANRATKTYSQNYKKIIENLTLSLLQNIETLQNY